MNGTPCYICLVASNEDLRGTPDGELVASHPQRTWFWQSSSKLHLAHRGCLRKWCHGDSPNSGLCGMCRQRITNKEVIKKSPLAAVKRVAQPSKWREILCIAIIATVFIGVPILAIVLCALAAKILAAMLLGGLLLIGISITIYFAYKLLRNQSSDL